jgi:predicted nicotinamide N-methyase
MYFSIAGDVDCNVRSQAIASNVIDSDFAIVVQDRAHGSDGSFDLVLAGMDPVHE